MGRGIVNSDGTVTPKDFYPFSHSLMDGTSVMPYILNKLGANLEPRKSSYIPKLSFLDHIRLIFKNLKLSPKSGPIWKESLPHAKVDLNEYARLALNREETKTFQKYSKENKISENSILVDLFSKEVLKLTNNSQDDLRWLFPVNIRGIVNKKSSYENHSSYIPIDVNKNTNYKQIQNQIVTNLKSLSYIGVWWVHHIGVLFGTKKMEKLSLASSKKNYWLGSFSNVGAWDIDTTSYDSLGENETWFFATPGSVNFPVSVIIMTYNGQMTFSLKINPKICSNSTEKAMGILEKIRHNINTLA